MGFWKWPFSITRVIMELAFGEGSVEFLSFNLGVLVLTFLLLGLIRFSPGSFGRLLFAG